MLYVRSPEDADDREIVYSFPDDDPYITSASKLSNARYYGEFSAFIDAVENPTKENLSLILSPFEDAVNTYDLTWHIREASEESTREIHSGRTLGSTISSEAPSSLEVAARAPRGPIPTSQEDTKDGKGIIGNLNESVEKLGSAAKGIKIE